MAGDRPVVKVLDPNCPTCQTKPGRETTGMVCQTCGTDYAPDAGSDAPDPATARALLLPERCVFTLLHCGQPMTSGGSRSTWQGRYPNGTSTVENGYVCTACGTTVNVKVVEPDRPDGGG